MYRRASSQAKSSSGIMLRSKSSSSPDDWLSGINHTPTRGAPSLMVPFGQGSIIPGRANIRFPQPVRNVSPASSQIVVRVQDEPNGGATGQLNLRTDSFEQFIDAFTVLDFKRQPRQLLSPKKIDDMHVVLARISHTSPV